MTYPIFRTDKGTIVDFKNGVWEKGAYTGQPLKFINFAALNHHSVYCGATSAIKNYLGITDLSGGRDPHNGGRLTAEYYNFHSFPFDKWAPGPVTGMIGAEIGYFMKTIRKADLNIVTAEWVGLSSRVDSPVARTGAVLASTDPVALDYHSAKYALYPNSRLRIHDPDDRKSPLHQYLVKCAEQGGGVLDEKYVKVESYDFLTEKIQKDEDLVVHAERQWGTNPKAILKYLYLRYGLTGSPGYYDMTAEQIATLERTGRALPTVTLYAPSGGTVLRREVTEGERVEVGTTLLDIADLSRIWVNASVYEMDLPFVKTGQKATMTLSYDPGKTLEGRVALIYPDLDAPTRTAHVRLEFPNPKEDLKPDRYTEVELQADLGIRLWVPAEAVLESGERSVVFVETGDGAFDPREVRLGLRLGDRYRSSTA